MSSVVKSLKRVMAGEYSRELSVKVFAGKARLLRLGFSPGGAAPYGLRRAIVDAKGNVQAKMERGEHKYLQTDRVSLVPGPESELTTTSAAPSSTM